MNCSTWGVGSSAFAETRHPVDESPASRIQLGKRRPNRLVARDRRLGEIQILLLLGRRKHEAGRVRIERLLKRSNVCGGRLLTDIRAILGPLPLVLAEILVLNRLECLRDIDSQEPSGQLPAPGRDTRPAACRARTAGPWSGAVAPAPPASGG